MNEHEYQKRLAEALEKIGSNLGDIGCALYMILVILFLLAWGSCS